MQSELFDSLTAVKKASRVLQITSVEVINHVLNDLAQEIIKNQESILAANKLDLARMDINDSRYDRLLLSPERLQAIASDLRNVSSLKSPVGEILEQNSLENGLILKKVRVPLGVIGVIYEARPNVTVDVFALCLKSGNACVLKGGSDAIDSNRALVSIIHQVLEKNALPTSTVYLTGTDRETTKEILQANQFLDILIPRGSQSLIDFVRKEATVPVIETGAGIVHTYFDLTGDLEKGQQIIANAKTRRVSVCNALDTLIIHQDRLKDLLVLVQPLEDKGVTIWADQYSYQRLAGQYPSALLEKATDESFGQEFLSLQMAIKVVKDLDEAIEHITTYSSRHSEAIISEDPKSIESFLNQIDAAVVYANTSTAFTDGAQFGMGAEIGISTQKLHARGPMALPELTSYKWKVYGTGQIRS